MWFHRVSLSFYIYDCFKYRKGEGIHFYTDNEFRAMTTPGPCEDEYPTDISVIKKNRSSAVALKIPNKGLSTDWKFKKDDKPWGGTYETIEANLK